MRSPDARNSYVEFTDTGQLRDSLNDFRDTVTGEIHAALLDEAARMLVDVGAFDIEATHVTVPDFHATIDMRKNGDGVWVPKKRRTR